MSRSDNSFTAEAKAADADAGLPALPAPAVLKNDQDSTPRPSDDSALRPPSSAKSSPPELAPRRWIDVATVFPTLLEPKQHTAFQKSVILAVVSAVTLMAPFTGNAFLPAFPLMRTKLNADPTMINLTTTVFLIALGICPMWHAYLSERYGRRPVYIFTTIIFVISSILLARATDINTVLGLRFLQAVGSSTAQSVGAGTLNDIYYPHQKGRAMAFYSLMPNLGPLLAPILGGVLVGWHGWHAIAWFLALYGLAMWMSLVTLLPETKRKPTIARLPSPIAAATISPSFIGTLRTVLYDFIIRPLLATRCLLFPPIGLTTLYISMCFACTFAYSTTIPYEFSAWPYNFTPLLVATMFIPGCIGLTIGSFVAGRLGDIIVKKAQLELGADYNPECRLRVAWLGAPIIPIGLLIYGWTIQFKTFTIWPLVGTFTFCLGFQLANNPILSYYTEALHGKSASVVAVYNLVRMLIGAIVSAVAPTAIYSIGSGWFMTILASLCLLGVLALEAVRRWGTVWRKARAEKEARASAPPQELTERPRAAEA